MFAVALDKFHKRLKPLAVFGTLSVILLVAGLVRAPSFWLPHWQGDQSQYVALAMKMNAVPGLAEYNLRRIEVRILESKLGGGVEMAYHKRMDEDVDGDLFRVYREAGIEYYNMPFFYKAPFFPAMLVFSHNLFTGGDHPFAVVKSNLGFRVFRERPSVLIKSQFWAAIVPFFCSLALILTVFFLGRSMFGAGAGLFAAWALAVHTVDVFVSSRLWTEGPAALYVTLSMFAFWAAYNRRSLLGVFFAGVIMGFALLTNQKVLLFLPSVWLVTVLDHKRGLLEWRAWPRIVFNRMFVWFFIGALLISHAWFHTIYLKYGNPFWQPVMKGSAKTDWIILLRSRPHSAIVYGIGMPLLCPPMLAVYASCKSFVVDLWRMLRKRIRITPVVFCWLWILPFFLYHTTRAFGYAPEHRYVMPVYPPMAVLAGWGLRRFQVWVGGFFMQPAVGRGLVVLLAAASAVWSVYVGWEAVCSERNLIITPF